MNTRSKKLAKPKKTTAKSTTITKVPQPRGGSLNSGGTPGNKGGGRHPNEVIQLATTLSFEELIPRLRELINDQSTPAKTVVSACAAIIGLVPKKEEGLPPDRVRALCQSYSQQVMQIVAEIVPDAFLAIQARVEEQLAQVGA